MTSRRLVDTLRSPWPFVIAALAGLTAAAASAPLATALAVSSAALIALLAVLLCSIRPTVSGAQEAPPPPRTGPTDVARLEAFIDGVMKIQLDEHSTAGAGVAVVRDGEVFFATGYGYAD